MSWVRPTSLIDYYHGNALDLPALAGQLGAGYAIPIIYVPLLMITHAIAFYLAAASAIRGRARRRRLNGPLRGRIGDSPTA